MYGSSILIFLLTQGDDIFGGKMLGVAALGFYQMPIESQICQQQKLPI